MICSRQDKDAQTAVKLIAWNPPSGPRAMACLRGQVTQEASFGTLSSAMTWFAAQDARPGCVSPSQIYSFLVFGHPRRTVAACPAGKKEPSLLILTQTLNDKQTASWLTERERYQERIKCPRIEQISPNGLATGARSARFDAAGASHVKHV